MAVGRTPSLESTPDVVDHLLDGGITIIDREVFFSLFCLELLAVEARATVLSCDTYLEYAEAVGLIPLKGRRHVTEYLSRGEARDWLRFPWMYFRWLGRLIGRDRRRPQAD
jgi:hypothetical protein